MTLDFVNDSRISPVDQPLTSKSTVFLTVFVEILSVIVIDNV